MKIQLSDKSQEDDELICDCGYLIFLDEVGITPLRIVQDEDLIKCS